MNLKEVELLEGYLRKAYKLSHKLGWILLSEDLKKRHKKLVRIKIDYLRQISGKVGLSEYTNDLNAITTYLLQESDATQRPKLIPCISHKIMLEEHYNNNKKACQEEIKEILIYLEESANIVVIHNEENILYLSVILKKYTKEDCINVIDHMVRWWDGKPMMKKCLKPSTLFKLKNFEKYLLYQRKTYREFLKEYETELKMLESGGIEDESNN